MTPGPGIELETHWWKASALTTTPTLLPYRFRDLTCISWLSNCPKHLTVYWRYLVIVLQNISRHRTSEKFGQLCESISCTELTLWWWCQFWKFVCLSLMYRKIQRLKSLVGSEKIPTDSLSSSLEVCVTQWFGPCLFLVLCSILSRRLRYVSFLY